MFFRNLSQPYSRILVILTLAAAMLLLLFSTMSWAAQAAGDRSPQLNGGALNNAYDIEAADYISPTISNDEALYTGDEGTAGRSNSHQWQSGREAPTEVQTNGNQTFHLFTGTALNPIGTSHSAYEINVYNNISATIFSGRAVWGATYDVVNERVLFTSDGGAGLFGGEDLYQWIPGDGSPTLVGTITVTDTGNPLRIDGLAISNGVFYGSLAGGIDDGIYLINSDSLTATLILSTTDSISGIDADPNTGALYGVNDTTSSLVSIDVSSGTITTVVAYPEPGTESDIDGLAIGPNGRAYLIPDDPAPGLIYVYNLNTDLYEPPLTAPWVGTDTFSGGAFIYHNVYVPAILKASGP